MTNENFIPISFIIYVIIIIKGSIALFLFGPLYTLYDRLCGLLVRVLGYRSGGPGSIPGTTRKKNVVGLERGPLSFVSTNWGAT
jgi:hypothetical protein